MAELDTVTEVATPAEEVVEETSGNVEPETSDTLTAEPETTEEAADIETETPQGNNEPAPTEQEPVLYAGKYKDIPAFEKGYKELNAQLTKQQEQINAYLKAEQERQAKAHQQALEQAKYRGFETVEDAQIGQQTDLAEFNYYWQNVQSLPPEYAKEAENALREYYKTYNKAYLEDAKRYFPSNFIEQVAIAKSTQEQQLRQALNAQKEQQHSQQEQDLANQIRETHAEFLADIEKNSAKSAFLKLACAANVINSPEDMQVFATEYTNLEKAIKEQVRQEIEAEKAIAEAENKAVIGANTATGSVSTLKDTYTAADIAKMTPDEFGKLWDKDGDEFMKRIKK
jgi:small-conductance mechanosensitive channel